MGGEIKGIRLRLIMKQPFFLLLCCYWIEADKVEVILLFDFPYKLLSLTTIILFLADFCVYFACSLDTY